MAAKTLKAHNNGTEIEVIQADKLFVDDGYQRISKNSARAKRIKSKFNWENVHTFLVAPRKRGRYACVDGGVRLEAIELRFPGMIDDDGKKINLRCEVLKKRPKVNGHYVNEAVSFLGAQDEQRSPSCNDAFKARRYAGQRVAVRTFDIAKKHGINIRFRETGSKLNIGRNQTRHGGGFCWAYELLGEAKYIFMMKLLTCFVRDDETGDIESKALQGTFIRGIAIFLNTTEMSNSEILESVIHCDSAEDIVEWAWINSRSGYQRPYMVSDGIERSMLKGNLYSV